MERVEAATLLPVTDKKGLMARFDGRDEHPVPPHDRRLAQRSLASGWRFAPLALGLMIDRTPGVEQFQVMQAAPTRRRVRLRLEAGADPARVWEAVHTEITTLLLTEHGLGHVTLERAEESPEQSPGGKYPEIIPLSY